MSTLLSVRAALVVTMAAMVAIIAFVLAYYASPTRNFGAAALVAGGAGGGALITANQLLGT